MRVVLIALMTTAAITGCASKRPPREPAPYVDLSTRYEAYFKCMVGRAYVTDDLMSDARTIAIALQNDCMSEWNDYFRHSITGMKLTADGMMRLSSSGRADAAINAVLTSRKLRQEAEKPRPAATPI